MIGIIGALKKEMRQLNSQLTGKKQVVKNSLTFNVGKLNGVDVVTNISGMGKVFAAMSAQIMIINFKPSLIINLGAAGSLSPDIHITDVAIGTRAVQHDMDLSLAGAKLGEVVGTGRVWFECDKNGVEVFDQCARQLNLNVHKVSVATGDLVVNTNEAKAKITKNFDAQIVEMEGAAIGQVCFVYKTPYLIVRAISDEANSDSVKNFTKYVNQVIANVINLLELALAKLSNLPN